MGEPTYWPTDINKTPDLLDFFIFKGLLHNSLDIRQSRYSIGSHTNNRHHQYRYYNSPKLHNNETNWEAFRTQIEEKLRLNIPLKPAKDIEETIAKFTNLIEKAAWNATPDDKSQTKYPEYPWKVKDQIKEKRKLRRRWQMSRHPEDILRYKEAAKN
jgi:hypothetical protein